jgi:hypothetical protein
MVFGLALLPGEDLIFNSATNLKLRDRFYDTRLSTGVMNAKSAKAAPLQIDRFEALKGSSAFSFLPSLGRSNKP